MNLIRRLFQKKHPIVYHYKKIYPPCGREYCFCLKTTDLRKKKNVELYLVCYRTWYISMNQ